MGAPRPRDTIGLLSPPLEATGIRAAFPEPLVDCTSLFRLSRLALTADEVAADDEVEEQWIAEIKSNKQNQINNVKGKFIE